MFVPSYVTGMATLLLFRTRKDEIDMALRGESGSVIRRRVSYHFFLLLLGEKKKLNTKNWEYVLGGTI